jgi:5-methylcytosine-specific restriction endonuclease McrA
MKLNNSKIRYLREKNAKQKGDHTKLEWEQMKEFFNNTCVICYGESNLENVEKDHIIPLYKNGSNSIQNIQPVCALCNSRKGYNTTDYRPYLAEYLNKILPNNYKNPF